ncbi:hypothetical protein CEXT_656071 [Caerostris extrusa]|uniref:Uncharacterized protein n=1 Tax=Caerostris extrusa TaxID=172846 RepID=A0AAV4X0R7_CAEEX|nr:hypothetical protein CEXT_656071 [Caerostris extrusa]
MELHSNLQVFECTRTEKYNQVNGQRFVNVVVRPEKYSFQFFRFGISKSYIYSWQLILYLCQDAERVFARENGQRNDSAAGQ